MEIHAYNRALKEYRKWISLGRPLNYLCSKFLTTENQLKWFDIFDSIGKGG